MIYRCWVFGLGKAYQKMKRLENFLEEALDFGFCGVGMNGMLKICHFKTSLNHHLRRYMYSPKSRGSV